jgi:hypothetical protein
MTVWRQEVLRFLHTSTGIDDREIFHQLWIFSAEKIVRGVA